MVDDATTIPYEMNVYILSNTWRTLVFVKSYFMKLVGFEFGSTTWKFFCPVTVTFHRWYARKSYV